MPVEAGAREAGERPPRPHLVRPVGDALDLGCRPAAVRALGPQRARSRDARGELLEPHAGADGTSCAGRPRPAGGPQPGGIPSGLSANSAICWKAGAATSPPVCGPRTSGSSTITETRRRGRDAGTKPMNDERYRSTYVLSLGSTFCAVPVFPATV